MMRVAPGACRHLGACPYLRVWPCLATWLCLVACSVPSPVYSFPEPKAPDAAEAATRHSEPRVATRRSLDFARPSELGHSVEGREIRATWVGYGPRRVLLVGGIHGNEREGEVAAREILAAFQRSSDLMGRVTLCVVDDLNPDGSAANTRGNARGVDLNRDFPARNREPGSPALTQPESKVLHDLVLCEEWDAVIVLHSWGRKPTGPPQFINYDGPGRDLARAFATIHPDYPVKESRHLPPTPGSLGSWIGKDLGIPIFTLEYARGRDPDLAWADTREGLLALVRGGS